MFLFAQPLPAHPAFLAFTSVVLSTRLRIHLIPRCSTMNFPAAMGRKNPKYPWLPRPGFTWPAGDGKMFTLDRFRKNWALLPLVFINCTVICGLPLFIWHRAMVSTIDVRFDDYDRYEIPSKPRFFDLRNPRSLKLMNTHNWKPAYHLDNRYRLMRNEPMLDPEGNETTEIGEDDTANNLELTTEE